MSERNRNAAGVPSRAVPGPVNQTEDSPSRSDRAGDGPALPPQYHAIVNQVLPNEDWHQMSAGSRRQFLKVMGASLALAGMTGCRWPKEKIVPYANRPEGRTPGVPERYATAMEIGGVATGLLVTSYDGRPIKIEGNPQHPFSLGATSAIHQASVLELYDPDRSRTVIRREGGQEFTQTWDDLAAFMRTHFADVRKRHGKGFAILSEATSSPSVADMRARLQKAMPDAKWYEYEPISYDNEREGTRKLFGVPCRPQYAFDKTDVVVCIDADPLGTHPAAVRYAHDFAQRRRADDGTMVRLYVIEPTYSLTGAMADHRLLQLPPLMVFSASSIECDVAIWTIPGGRPVRSERLRNPPKPGDIINYPLYQSDLFHQAAAKDLHLHRRRAVVLAGARQSAWVHEVVHRANLFLGSAGTAVTYRAEPDSMRPSHVESIRSLVEDLRSGKVQTLLILGGNPVYNAPADLEFADALKRVKTSIHLSLYDNETSHACTWQIPRAHYLESWGDARAYDGTVSLVQPLIDALYGGKTPAEVLAMLSGEEPTSAYDIARRAFAQMVEPKDLDRAWREALHDGVVPNTAWLAVRPDERTRHRLYTPYPPASAPDMESRWISLVFCEDHKVHDGRFANNAWLQEMPDPMTKMTWENVAVMSPATAKVLRVGFGDMVRLTVRGRSVVLPVYVMPGQALGSVSVCLGYGQRNSGRVGDGAGRDVYPLRTSGAMGFDTDVKIEKVVGTGRYRISSTEDHYHSTEVTTRAKQERIGQCVAEGDLAQYKANPHFASEVAESTPPAVLWTEHKFGPNRWGMAIDLSVCTGCGACVLACQAENNSPVVGREQVIRRREMHWLRVDRYFRGDPDSPTVSHQLMFCVQCENAPCEQVCPVSATVHDQEGLNQMVYNRCVGTRYCSNNCPFKVRRFNFFNYRLGMTDLDKMVMNPEVTVRSRGVMEKCSYCIQRIRAATVKARNERRPVRDGEIVTACQQVCPTRAIVFGDLNDKESAVWKLHASARAYFLLGTLYVRPRTAYLAKLRNRNEELTKVQSGYVPQDRV
jgi:Fe-S-cluster-containing dehydrogenase component/anaerobic selenocysteine-containing dehydrogenase